jgi:hypothetical protein
MDQKNRSRRSKTAQLDLFGLAEPADFVAEPEATAPPGASDPPKTFAPLVTQVAVQPPTAPDSVAVDQSVADQAPAAAAPRAVPESLRGSPNLAALLDELMAIPFDDVRGDHAIGRFVALEYEYIAARAKAPEHVAALAAVGFPESRIDRIVVAARACAEVLRLRRAAADPAGPHAGAEVLREAKALQRKLVAAIRFHLPDTQLGRWQDGSIASATGAADLRSDLYALRALILHRPEAFAGDRTLDIDGLDGEIERLGLGLVTSGPRDYAELHAFDENRLEDRAFSYLARCVTELRDALSYVWQDDPVRARDVLAPAMGRRGAGRVSKGLK